MGAQDLTFDRSVQMTSSYRLRIRGSAINVATRAHLRTELEAYAAPFACLTSPAANQGVLSDSKADEREAFMEGVVQ